jgi:hypothetical protein
MLARGMDALEKQPTVMLTGSLSKRAVNSIKNAGIASVEEARLWCDSEFLRQPNVGLKTLKEINAWRFDGLSDDELRSLNPPSESLSERRARLRLELDRHTAVSVDHMVRKFNLDGRDGLVQMLRSLGRSSAKRWLLEHYSTDRRAIGSLLKWVSHASQ